MTVEPSQHLQLALSGHQAALRGDHRSALGCYREAMHVAVRAGAPEVFFRHYLEAALESLELMGSLEEVLTYCQRAVDHYADHPPTTDLALLDLATIHQRRGVVLLKSGDLRGAREALDEAIVVAARAGATLDLARMVLGWLKRGLVITGDRLLAEQRRLKYFSVRPEAMPARHSASGGMAG